jgi:hypothetical protein
MDVYDIVGNGDVEGLRAYLDKNDLAAHEIPLWYIAKYRFDNYMELAKVSIDYGMSMDSNPYFTDTPLSIAIVSENTDLAILFIERGANINTRNSVGMSPFMLAVDEAPNVSFISYLIDKGGYVNDIEDIEYRSVLMIAAMRSNPPRPDIVSLLVEKGACTSIRDDDGRTALDLAKDSGVRDVLLSHSHCLCVVRDRSRDYMSSSYCDVDISFYR